MFAKFAIASISLLLALPVFHNNGSESSASVKVGDTLTVVLNDRIGQLYRTACGIIPAPTLSIGSTENTVNGVRTYTKVVTETSGVVVSVTDDGFTVRCMTTVEDHKDGPRMVSVTIMFKTGALQTATIPNPTSLFLGSQQPHPKVSKSVEMGYSESAEIKIWKLVKTLPEK